MNDIVAHPALWHWASPVWGVVAVLGALYVWMIVAQSRMRSCETSGHARTLTSSAIWFVVAMLLFAIAFVSPIGVLANGYLFSAHMVQHLLLLLVIPLCLIMSLPEEAVAHWLDRPRGRFLGNVLAIPLFGWILGIGAMWFWHVPSLCSAATQSYGLSIVRSASFLLAGLVFWWPIYAPIHRLRLRPLSAVVYLFSACLGCTLLGIYITFTSISVCPAFANPADRVGILTMLYDAGLTPATDQQLGGLLMWVPPCSLYICAIISVLSRWYAADETELVPAQFETHVRRTASS